MWKIVRPTLKELAFFFVILKEIVDIWLGLWLTSSILIVHFLQIPEVGCEVAIFVSVVQAIGCWFIQAMKWHVLNMFSRGLKKARSSIAKTVKDEQVVHEEAGEGTVPSEEAGDEECQGHEYVRGRNGKEEVGRPPMRAIKVPHSAK